MHYMDILSDEDMYLLEEEYYRTEAQKEREREIKKGLALYFSADPKDDLYWVAPDGRPSDIYFSSYDIEDCIAYQESYNRVFRDKPSNDVKETRDYEAELGILEP